MQNKFIKKACLPAAAVALMAQPALAEEEQGQWSFTSGIDYSTGDYGDEGDTDILFVPFSLGYSQGPWAAKVTVPWVQIKGPGSVIGGGDGGVVVGGAEAIDDSGLGDIWAQLSYSLESFPADYGYLDLVGKVKFPTADEDKGLGTGEFDYTLQVDYFKPLGKLTPMATVAYKIKGDPEGSELDNVFFLSAGADYRLNETINFGATLDWQDASSSASDDSLEIFNYLGYRVNDANLLTFYSYIGLSDGSPDIGGGIQWKYSF